jgi:hypothetical protein
MSELSSHSTEKTPAPKAPTSPARNIIGLIVLIGVVVFGWFEVSAKRGYVAAVTALETRSQDENKELLTVQEAESILGKAPDGPGSDFKDGTRMFNKQTYTWPGLFKRYTLTAYYTKEKDSRLHHYEPDGSKYEGEKPVPPDPGPRPTTKPAPKGQSAKSAPKVALPNSGPAAASDSKSPAASPDDKASTPKTQSSGSPPSATQPAEPGDKGGSSKSPDAPKSPQ